MTREAADLWARAQTALKTAKRDLKDDPDAAANRAYYAAFHAVNALFAVQGKSFSKHSAVEAAVHRDLVNQGFWPKDLGAAYAGLVDTRNTGDYGGGIHVSTEEAADAIRTAEAVLKAVHDANPGLFVFEKP